MRLRIVGLLSPLLLLLPLAAPSTMASDASIGRSVQDHVLSFGQLGQATQTLTGSQPVLDLYVPGPGRVGLRAATLHVVYMAAPLLDPANSSLAVYANGTNVGGQMLTVRPTRQTSFDLTVPATSLHSTGFNHLQLAFTLRDRTRWSCNVTDPSLYVTVFGASWFRYHVVGRARPAGRTGLESLPEPFVGTSPVGNARLTVVLPVVPTPQELSGVAGVLARFGEDRPANPPTVSTVGPYGLRRWAHGSPILLVGTPADNPALAHLSADAPVRVARGAWRTYDGRALPAGEGLIVEGRNPWDRSQPALAVTGNDREALRRASLVLTSQTLRRLLHGTYALLPSAPSLPPEPVAATGERTLAQLGYNTSTVTGYGEHDLRYSFDLQGPAARDGRLQLTFSHSATATSALSSVRVDLNGQPLASRPFQSSDPLRTSWSVPLPSDQLQLGSNVLLVHIFLGSPDVSCSLPANDSLWGEVFSSSTLDVPSAGTVTGPDLRLMPFPLVLNGSPRDTVLVLPDLTRQQGNALQLAALLGSHCSVDAPQLTATGARQVHPRLLRDHTVVLDGLTRTNPLVRRVAPYLPLRADPALRLSGRTAALDASVREGGSVGVAEEFQSPWNASRLALLFSATQAALLPGIRRSALAGDLTGTVAMRDSHGTVQGFNTVLRSPAAPRQPTRPVRALTVAGIVALLLVVAATTWDRRRRGERTP